MDLSLQLKKIPEFSADNYRIASYICGGLSATCVGWFLFEMFKSDSFGITVNWNIFKSSWFVFFYIIGLILAIVFWGRWTHWSYKEVTVTKDRFGNVIDVNDTSDFMGTIWSQFVFPLLGHFVIEPIIYACLIYYPLMCVLALLGLILPYAITLILIGVLAMIFMSAKYTNIKYRSTILIMTTLLLTLGLGYSAYSMNQTRTEKDIFEGPYETQQTTSNKEAEEIDSMFEESSNAASKPQPETISQESDDIDEMFK